LNSNLFRTVGKRHSTTLMNRQNPAGGRHLFADGKMPTSPLFIEGTLQFGKAKKRNQRENINAVGVKIPLYDPLSRSAMLS
jgi:hypothetical protein